MKTLRFVQKGGSELAVRAEDRLSVMQVAKTNEVEGVDAICGGSAVCGTCHVYVLDGIASKLPPPSEMEQMILEELLEPRSDARLSCQIKVADCPDGTRFELPPNQN